MNRKSPKDPDPISSPEAERAVLGSCILSAAALASVISTLKPEDFLDERNRSVFSSISAMYIADKPVDYVTLSDELSSSNLLDRLGGQSYIDWLVEDITSIVNVGYYADILRERSVRRKLVYAGEQIAKLPYDYNKPIQAIFDEAEKMIFDASQNKNEGEFRHVSEFINPVFVNIEERMRSNGTLCSGYPTGFMDLDVLTGGLQPGTMNVIAARPSMGKTAFAMNIAQFGGGQQNAPVMVFSLEMPAEQLVLRMISAQSEIDLSRLTHGLLDTEEFGEIRKACNIVAQRNIFISDVTMLSAIDFLGKCRRFKTRYPDLALIVVDYLQLMRSGEQPERTANRQQEVADISRIMKVTAREMNCPVLALSQLSRESERRTDKKPQLSDLRDSGAIEQDADLVMMLFREDYYSDNEKNELKDSKADIRIAKNRNGSTGVFSLTFKREITRFYDFGDDNVGN